MAQTLKLVAYNADGQVVTDTSGEFDEAPEFYAHQLLHAKGMVAVEVFTPDDPDGWRSVLRRADPGLVFEQVVQP